MLSVRLEPKAGNLEIHIPPCPKCRAPMRIYHYLMRELTPHANEAFVETEGQKQYQVYSFEFMCPSHKDKKDLHYMDGPGLLLVNQYTPKQFKMIIDSEPGAKATEKVYRGDEAKKAR